MDKFALFSFISTLKNLRGVIYFDPQEKVEEGIKWVANRFRYRGVGNSNPQEIVTYLDPLTVLSPLAEEDRDRLMKNFREHKEDLSLSFRMVVALRLCIEK